MGCVNQPTSSRTSSTGREARRYIRTCSLMRVLMVAPRTLMRMLMVGARLDMLRARLMRMLMLGAHLDMLMVGARLDITLRLLSFAVPAIPAILHVFNY